MKIYTKVGDAGLSGLIGKTRLSKTEDIFELLGTFDELNAYLGVVLAGKVPVKVKKELQQIQQDLFEAGAFVAGYAKSEKLYADYFIKRTMHLEEAIDKLDAQLKPLTKFVMPGGNFTGSGLHYARSITRRLERVFFRAKTCGSLSAVGECEFLGSYLNRLSDFIFVLARYSNKVGKSKESFFTSFLR